MVMLVSLKASLSILNVKIEFTKLLQDSLINWYAMIAHYYTTI